MKENSIRRLERLEGRAGINDEELTIIIKAIGTDENRNRTITGGIRIRPGKPYEELPLSFFKNEDNHETS